ncbi:MAG: hypothetical protein ACQEQL_05350 [Pseudomonadota bacterium]
MKQQNEYLTPCTLQDFNGNPLFTIDYKKAGPLLKQAIDNHNHDKIAEMAKDDVDLNAIDKLGFNPILHALETRKMDCIETLLFFNANPNAGQGAAFVYTAQQDNCVALKAFCQDHSPEKDTRDEMLRTAIRQENRAYLEMMSLLGLMSDLTGKTARQELSDLAKGHDLDDFVHDLLNKANRNQFSRDLSANKADITEYVLKVENKPRLKSRRSKTPPKP